MWRWVNLYAVCWTMPRCCCPKIVCENPEALGYLLTKLASTLAGIGILTLSPALSATVLSSLCFGVAHHELCVSQRALETVYELSRRAVRSHLVEVAIHLLQPLLTQLLLLLLHARLHGELLDPSAGNALLSLVVATPAHWGALSQQLVALQPSAEQQQATAQALGALTSANGVVCAPPDQALLRPNRARFRANLPALLLFARTSRMVLPPCEGS